MKWVNFVLNLISVLTGLVGLLYCFWLLFTGLIYSEKQKVGKAIKVLFITSGVVLFVTIIQFILAAL